MDEHYLSEAEQNSIVAFCANKIMFGAVKKVVLHTIHHQGVLQPGVTPEETNWVFALNANSLGSVPSNESLGEEVKASLKGLGFLNEGFKRLSDIKVKLPAKPKVNPAL